MVLATIAAEFSRGAVPIPNILVIDDQKTVRLAVMTVLRANGFNVIEAADGIAGLKKFIEFGADLAIIDIYLPGVDGVNVIKQLRRRAPNLPIVAMSGVLIGTSQSSVMDMLPSAPGMSEIVCLHKPFKAAQLLMAVVRAFEAVAKVS